MVEAALQCDTHLTDEWNMPHNGRTMHGTRCYNIPFTLRIHRTAARGDPAVMPVVKIGGVDIEPAHAKPQRMSMLLWGVSGAGKTTLACTAPGRKLLVSFDPDGAASIAHRTDVDVADLADVSHGVVEQFKSQENPLGIGKVLDEYDTIIIDSLTNAQHMSVMHAVTKVTGATIERPSMQGYGHRNALLTQLVKNVLRMTARCQ